MTTKELRSYIDRVLGNNIRTLLPSYWWKRLFGMVVDKVGDVDRKTALALTKSNENSHAIEEKTTTVTITDNLENNKKVVEAITGGWIHNPVRVVYKNMVATYCTHYYGSYNNEPTEFYCYVVFSSRSNFISDERQKETTTVIRLFKDGTKEVKTYVNAIIEKVDSVLSSSSTNPIQNRAVNAALANKANKDDITTLEGYLEPLVLFVPEIGKSLPRILGGRNSSTIINNKALIERLKNNRDIHNPREIAPRVVVFVYHETINSGTLETDEEYVLTQHDGLNVRVHEREDGGYNWDSISADFVDFNGQMCTATISEGGEKYAPPIITKIELDSELSETVDALTKDVDSLKEKVDELADGKAYIMDDRLVFRNYADAKIEGETLKL